MLRTPKLKLLFLSFFCFSFLFTVVLQLSQISSNPPTDMNDSEETSSLVTWVQPLQTSYVPPVLNKNRTDTQRTNKTSYVTTPNQIFIYHTHNRESWIPELSSADKAEEAFDETINVTLLGKRLSERLKSKGLKSIHSDKDYPSQIGNFIYARSYQYSKQIVKDTLEKNDEIRYMFDLHRDAEGREKTTIRFQNKNFAQVYFVVGTEHSNWKYNKQFAEAIQERLNQRIPNLSKGIYLKDKSSGNGEYNQSLSTSSALIEIGGVENTLDESYRTIDVLAEVIQELTKMKEQPAFMVANL